MRIPAAIILTIPLTITSCSDSRTSNTTESLNASRIPTVCVVNYPLQYFAQRIGGREVEVLFPVPADVDPAHWAPSAEQIGVFQDADLILINGAGYAGWTTTVSLPASKIVNTSKAAEDHYIAIQGETTHVHGPAGDHVHGEFASTTWLDPGMAAIQARAVETAFSKAWPGKSEFFRTNADELAADLGLLNSKTRAAIADRYHGPVIFSRPVYQYFARAYELKGTSVNWSPDETPSRKMWGEVERIRKETGADWMIWEALPAEATVEGLRQIGISIAIFDPCANLPASGDFMTTLSGNLTIPAVR